MYINKHDIIKKKILTSFQKRSTIAIKKFLQLYGSGFPAVNLISDITR